MYAAGVLPISWVGQDMYILIGQDARNAEWSDFAGKYEKVDKDQMWTASREFFEETYGVLMDAKTMRHRLESAAILLHGHTQNCHPYYCYLTEVPFLSHLRQAFHRHLTFMRQRNVHRMYMEKSDIMYISIQELFSDDIVKRSVFKETLHSHRKVLFSIAEEGPKGFAVRVPRSIYNSCDTVTDVTNNSDWPRQRSTSVVTG